MRFRFPIFIVAAFFAFLFNSCKKEKDAPLVFPLNFYTEKVEVKTATKMFKAAGQVTNGAEISTVLTGIDNFDLEKQRIDKDKIVITFNSESQATISDGNRKFSIEKNGNQFLFYSESDFLVAGNPAYPSNAIFRAMLKYLDKIVNTSPWLPPLTREIRVAYGNYKGTSLFCYSLPHLQRCPERRQLLLYERAYVQ